MSSLVSVSAALLHPEPQRTVLRQQVPPYMERLQSAFAAMRQPPPLSKGHVWAHTHVPSTATEAEYLAMLSFARLAHGTGRAHEFVCVDPEWEHCYPILAIADGAAGLEHS